MTPPATGQDQDHTPRPLPFRPRPITGETAASYVRRLARANHLRPGYLRRYLQEPGSPAQVRLDWLAILAGRDQAAIERAITGPPPGPRPRPAARKQSRAALFAKIRQDAGQAGMSVRALADRHGVHRRTVRQALESPMPAPRRPGPPRTSRLDPYKSVIDDILRADAASRPKDRRTARDIHQLLVTEHEATGISYSTVANYIGPRRPFPPPVTGAARSRRRGSEAREGPPGQPADAGSDCLLCAVAAAAPGQDLIILRTGAILAVLASWHYPAASPGQVVVFPAAHLDTLQDADPGIITELFSTAARIAAVIPDALGAAGAAVIQDSTPGPAWPHLHVQVIPRFPGDASPFPGKPPARHLAYPGPASPGECGKHWTIPPQHGQDLLSGTETSVRTTRNVSGAGSAGSGDRPSFSRSPGER